MFARCICFGVFRYGYPGYNPYAMRPPSGYPPYPYPGHPGYPPGQPYPQPYGSGPMQQPAPGYPPFQSQPVPAASSQPVSLPTLAGSPPPPPLFSPTKTRTQCACLHGCLDFFDNIETMLISASMRVLWRGEVIFFYLAPADRAELASKHCFQTFLTGPHR